LNDSEELSPTLSHPPLKTVIRLLLLTILLVFAIVLINSLAGNAGLPQSVQLIMGELALIVPSLVYLRKKNYDLRQVFRIKRVALRTLLSAALLGAALPILSTELDNLVNQLIKLPDELKEPLAEILIANSWFDWLNLIIATVILASLIEEMLFRGLLQQALEKQFEATHAIFLSAFIFAIFHGPIWMIQVMIIGILFGYLAWRGKSVVPGIIVHAFHNLFSLTATNFADASPIWNTLFDWRGHVHPTLIAISACVMFYALKWFEHASAKSENP